MAFAALQPAFVGADCLFFARLLRLKVSNCLYRYFFGGVSFLKPLALRLCLRISLRSLCVAGLAGIFMRGSREFAALRDLRVRAWGN